MVYYQLFVNISLYIFVCFFYFSLQFLDFNLNNFESMRKPYIIQKTNNQSKNGLLI